MSLKPPVAPNNPLLDSTNVQNVVDHGAGGGSLDTALVSALDALGDNGGIIYIPSGAYTVASFPSFAESRHVQLIGEGGEGSGATAPTKITYTGTATRAIDARASAGFRLKDLQLLYNQASFTGSLVDLSGSAWDSAYAVLENLYLGGGSGVRGADCLVNLDKAIVMSFRDCVFAGAANAVRGQAAAGSYSNVVSFYNCTFLGQTSQHVRNAGEAWLFSNCTFENLVSGAGAAAGAGALTYDTNVVSEGVVFDACWFGDANTTGDWINFNGQGLTITGCHIGAGAVGVRIDANNIIGVTILGNIFDGQATAGIVAGGTGHRGYVIQGNVMIAGSAPVATLGGTFPTGSRIQDPSNAAGAFTYSSELQVINAAIGDGSFPFVAVDGMMGMDSLNSVLALRVGGTWRYAPTMLRSAVSWDPPSIAHGASTSSTFTVTGAVFGDYVVLSQTGLPGGCILAGQVTAADTVTVTLANLSGSSQDLNFGTMRVAVLKKY